MATTYEAIATVTVGSGGAADIEFTSIPATYTDLLAVISGRTDTAAASGGALVYLNLNSSSANFTAIRIQGNGSAASSNSDTSVYGRVNPSDYTASTFGNSSFYITNYAGSNNKAISIDAVVENNATAAVTMLLAGLWSNSAAITSVKLAAESGVNFVQHTSATLYGIKNS